MLSYGLIGHPLGHSFSARFFAEKFAAEGLDARYDNYDLADISEVEQLRHLQGFNVTIPYKQAILPYLAGISPEAQAIGAVNTVRVIDGQFYGYNTDVIGFELSLHEWLQKQGVSPATFQALVLGTGGASRAICYVLSQLGIRWHSVSRTPAPGQYSYADLPTLFTEWGTSRPEGPQRVLLINCTPLGTFPNVETCPDIPYDLLTPNFLLYDLVYNPEVTRFLQQGHQHGCPTKNGLQMLHLQAIAAWQIWTESGSQTIFV